MREGRDRELWAEYQYLYFLTHTGTHTHRYIHTHRYTKHHTHIKPTQYTTITTTKDVESKVSCPSVYVEETPKDCGSRDVSP